jgi:hypothetical protein
MTASRSDEELGRALVPPRRVRAFVLTIEDPIMDRRVWSEWDLVSTHRPRRPQALQGRTLFEWDTESDTFEVLKAVFSDTKGERRWSAIVSGPMFRHAGDCVRLLHEDLRPEALARLLQLPMKREFHSRRQLKMF